MISRPDMRWQMFKSLCTLCDLRSALLAGEIPQQDARFFVETIETINDMTGLGTGEDLSPAIGFTLFDDVEADAVSKLLNMPWDDGPFHKLPHERLAYFRSEEWMSFLSQACVCIRIFLGKGRGLPGWDDSEFDRKP